MPAYDFRCKNCGERFTLTYKSVADYDEATPVCPNCGYTDLSRLITQVAIASPTRNYSKMSSNEMLSVLESGDSKQVGAMFQQVGGGDPALGAEYHEATQRLLKGESMEKVEKDLEHRQSDNKPSASDVI